MKHKYIFYYYPEWPKPHGKFFFFERVKEGKELGKRFGVHFDYQKLY
nr:MAG TPA: hypothetical protein [Microviridae sp.]